MIKQRKESLAVYEQGGRAELAEKERAEVAIIACFLPKQMDEAETKAAIERPSPRPAPPAQGHGQGHRRAEGKFAGRMDFGKASGLVKAALAGG